MNENVQRPLLRLLIVEDEALIADELQHRLVAMGHEVVAVCDTAAGAVAAAGQHRPDLVLMDIRLKGPNDGIDAAERIYAEFGIPIIYLTAHSDRATFARATAGAGIFGYLIKPVREHELVIAIDVALQRHRRGLELHESVLSCEALVRELADGVIVTDQGGMVRAMNRTAEVLCGCHAESALGLTLTQVLPLLDVDGRACIDDVALRLSRGERVEIRDATLPRADRTPREVWVTGSPVRDQLRVVGAVIAVRDITDRKAAIEAQRASRAKTEFLSRMSHELRTPLNAVLGFTELLVSDTIETLTDRQQRRLALVLDAARHLRALIDDVMDVSLIEIGQLPVSLTRVELEPALDGAVQLCADLARRHGVQIEPLYRGTGGVASADAVRLRQVLVNVLSNAIKYNRRGGAARVILESRSDGLLIHFADDGLGMTAEQLKHLFEPFNRLGQQHGPVEGTGLGMSLTRQLMRAMGGDISVDSREGAGTQVTLHLSPASPAAAPAGDGTDVTSNLPATGELVGCVLYIEDNPVNTVLVEEYLSRWPKLRVVSATTGAEGVARAESVKPDLVLLDMQLPDMDGVEVMRRLQANPITRSLPVLVLSAGVMPGDADRARHAGAMSYITKPLDLQQFDLQLRQYLGRPAR